MLKRLTRIASLRQFLMISTFVALTPSIGRADDQTTIADRTATIVVTGTRSPSVYTVDTTASFGPSTLTLLEVPQSIQVLTRDLINDQGVLSLAELLNNVAGASNSISRSTPFGTATTQVRGQDLNFVNRNLPNAAIPSISVVAPTYLVGGLQALLGPDVPFAQLPDTHEFFAQGVFRVNKATITGALRHIRSEFDRTSKLENTVFQLGASYAVTDNISAFVGTNSGFNANADIAASRNRLGVRFEPEEFRQIETGIKSSLFSGITATAALFSLTRDNILVTDPLDAAFLIQGGRERSNGGEIDLVWEPIRSLMFRGGYAYLDSKIIDDANVARIGLRKPNAPEHQFNLYASYTFESGALENLRLSAGIVYSGSTFAAITNTIERPEYTIANLNASYKIGRFRFDAIASNVFNEAYFLARNNAQVNAGEPRQVLFRVSTRL